MADGHENLGKASLDLTADMVQFERNIAAGRKTAEGMGSTLEHVAAIADIAEHALGRVKMKPGQGAESRASAEGILAGVRGISEEARDAARELDRVKLSELQAEETQVAGNRIERMLNGITRHANEARRSLESVRLVGGVPGRSGVGVGPFGSGFGRVGVLGAAIGAGTLLAPAAGPGAAGLLAAIPTLAFGAAGSLGTLVLAFKGVGKAIDGDKKAFDDLGPSAQNFVLTIRSLHGWFAKLKETAAGSLFPGLTAGLKAALSPGTTGALTTGVQQFGKAIGFAGEQWGKYFGSAKFQQLLGPLMQAGARNFVALSDAMLHIFDALSVLGRAAIPLTAWMTRAIDNGSRFASSWLRAKDATGQLGRAMNEAKSSLRLVGGLAASLLRVVGALGKALYPVSKVAVKALTDGLNALARIIQRNQRMIREIVGGALAALISTVKIAAPIVGALARALNRVAHAVGGWKTAFEIILSGFLASKLLGLSRAILLVGTRSGEAGAAGEVGLLARRLDLLKKIGPIAIGITVGYQLKGPIKSFFENQLGADFSGVTADVAGKAAIVDKLHLTAPKGTSLDADLARVRAGKQLTKGQILDVMNAFKRGDLTGGDTPSAKEIAELVDALEHPGRGLPKKLKHRPLASHATTHEAGSPFGTPPPFTKNVPAAKKPKKPHKTLHALDEKLKYALDVAKLAVENATAGTTAYDKAEKAEAKALRAEISFWDRRAHNLKLSRVARDKALREELTYKRELKSLFKPVATPSGANEAQFLSSFKDIMSAFAPNAFPQGQDQFGKATTHLYSTVGELREQTRILKDIHRGGRFPSSAYASEAALAVAG